MQLAVHIECQDHLLAVKIAGREEHPLSDWPATQ